MHWASLRQFSMNLYLYCSFYVLYNGQLFELHTTLDTFLPIPQVIYMEWLAGCGGKPQTGRLTNVSSIYTSYRPQLSTTVAPNVTEDS